jgi:hypothetical protein
MRVDMNLNLVHKLLQAANEQPHGFLKVCGARLAREVEMMAAAGLIEASETVQGLETFAVIKGVTDSGHSFLRAFRNDSASSLPHEPKAISPEERCNATTRSCPGTLAGKIQRAN